MLTMEEIKKALDAGNAVGLECIDVHMYCRTDSAFKHEREVIARSSLIITSIIGRGYFKALMISDCRYCIPENDLKHFRIKRPAPTFNDLIDVAVQAFKDNVIFGLDLEKDGICFKAKNLDMDICQDSVEIGIETINSLYTETFVIEQDSDIQKLKGEPNISLANGNEFVAKKMKIGSNPRGMFAIGFIDIDGYEMTYSFFELKGATVTQKRGAL